MYRTLRHLSLLTACMLAANAHAGKDDATCDHKERHAYHAKHFMPMHNKMIKGLDLNEEQQKQFQALRDESKTQHRMQYQALRENHQQLHELIASGGYTEDKAALLAKQHGDIAAELTRLRAAEMAQLYTLLTPAQQKKFSTMKFEHKERHPKGDKTKS